MSSLSAPFHIPGKRDPPQVTLSGLSPHLTPCQHGGEGGEAGGQPGSRGCQGPTGAADVPNGDTEGEVGLMGLSLGLQEVVAGGLAYASAIFLQQADGRLPGVGGQHLLQAGDRAVTSPSRGQRGPVGVRIGRKRGGGRGWHSPHGVGTWVALPGSTGTRGQGWHCHVAWGHGDRGTGVALPHRMGTWGQGCHQPEQGAEGTGEGGKVGEDGIDVESGDAGTGVSPACGRVGKGVASPHSVGTEVALACGDMGTGVASPLGTGTRGQGWHQQAAQGHQDEGRSLHAGWAGIHHVARGTRRQGWSPRVAWGTRGRGGWYWPHAVGTQGQGRSHHAPWRHG